MVILIIADGLIIFIYVDAFMEPEMEIRKAALPRVPAVSILVQHWLRKEKEFCWWILIRRLP